MATEKSDRPWGLGTWWSEAPLGHVRSGPQRFPAAWLLLGTAFLLPLVVPTVQHVIADDLTVLTYPLLVLYSACYLAFPLILPRESLRIRLIFCAVMLVTGWLLLLILGLGTLFLLVYALATIGFAAPVGWVLVFDGASAAAAVVLLAATGQLQARGGDLVTVVSVTGAIFFMGRMVRAIRNLRGANEEIAMLAVAEERARVARELHDILGHSLTTITVKAGLTRRILESSADTERAITEIRELEALSRSALSDVRATVSEYREVSLAAELAGARAALRAAEIEAELPHAVDNVRPDLQSTFGYVLREAVTNVLRHSGAQHVKVRFGSTWLEIEDDGTTPGAVCRAGNGLRGLQERLTQVGGTVRAAPRPEGGFLVRADAPVAGLA